MLGSVPFQFAGQANQASRPDLWFLLCQRQLTHISLSSPPVSRSRSCRILPLLGLLICGRSYYILIIFTNNEMWGCCFPAQGPVFVNLLE